MLFCMKNHWIKILIPLVLSSKTCLFSMLITVFCVAERAFSVFYAYVFLFYRLCDALPFCSLRENIGECIVAYCR